MIKHLAVIPNSSSSFSWNTQLQTLTNTNQHSAAISLYKLMLSPPNPLPNIFTFPSILRSSTSLSLPLLTSQLHSHVIKLHCLSNPHVLTSLISSYSRLSLLELAESLLDPYLVVSYNSLISGYSLHSRSHSALSLFRRMIRSALPFNAVTVLSLLPSLPSPTSIHSILIRSGFASNVSIANCVITSYSKSGDTQLARRVFDEIPDSDKDVITYNAMVSGYAQNGLAADVLEIYRRIGTSSGKLRPDPVTLVGVLSACANLGAHSIGRDVQRIIVSDPDFTSNVFLNNALINMHSRCGDLQRAREIFRAMPEKTLVSWTVIIAGYGMHGHGRIAVELFDQMLLSGVKPDGVVMVSILSACSHSGLTDKGMEYFCNMEIGFGIASGPEHYACVVDLLGRAGRLNDAWELVGSMPVKPDGGVWGSLLGACKIHRDVRLGELAFERLVEVEPTNVGYYVLMSNIYLDAGRLDGVARVRAMMRKRGLKKEPGCSYVELEGKVHLFMADDRSHPLTKSIYEMIAKLEGLVKDDKGEGGDGDGGEDEERVVGFHSEKLAVAFGLLSTEAGVEILVIKNLRVCEDCHVFMKLVSKIVNRKMVIRDASRFHHFEGGVCSCNDYY